MQCNCGHTRYAAVWQRPAAGRAAATTVYRCLECGAHRLVEDFPPRKPEETPMSAANTDTLLPNLASLQTLLAEARASVEKKLADDAAAKKAHAALVAERTEALKPMVALVEKCMEAFAGFPCGNNRKTRVDTSTPQVYGNCDAEGGLTAIVVVNLVCGLGATSHSTVANIGVRSDNQGVSLNGFRSLEDGLRYVAASLRRVVVS
jgi:hypothetical protein